MKYYLINKNNKSPIVFNNRECVFLYLHNRLENNKELKEKVMNLCNEEERTIVRRLRSLYSSNYKIYHINFLLKILDIKILSQKEVKDGKRT